MKINNPLPAWSLLIQVRLRINTKNTGWHTKAPYVGVQGCWFFNHDPAVKAEGDSANVSLTNEHGCNEPPSYYDPFTAARIPGVNGMYMNKQPVDNWLISNEGGLPSKNADPKSNGSYLSGFNQSGMAYSDVFRMFKFPGKNLIWVECELRFCVDRNDPRCITVRGILMLFNFV